MSGGTVSATYQKSMYCDERETGANCVQTGSVTKGVTAEVDGLWGLGWQVGRGRGRRRLR